MQQRVEQLVGLLFTQATPKEVSQQAQREIQDLQKSPEGWLLGHILLESLDPQAQFLGAQSLLVQLNSRDSLPPWPDVQSYLLNRLSDIASHRYISFVARKLLSVVVKAYFSSADWQDLPQVAMQTLQSKPQYAYEFLTILVEDSELDASAARAKLVPQASNVAHAYFVTAGLQSEEALKAFTTWASAFFDVFKDIVDGLIGLLATDVPKSQVYTSLTELYDVHWKSWSPQARRQLSETLLRIANEYPSIPPPDLVDDDEDFVAFMQLIITICLADFSQNTVLHPVIAQYAAAPFSVVDDPLAFTVLDFWTQFTDEVISSGMGSGSNELIASVISAYWPRVKLLPGLRKSDWNEFASFRRDFSDFLELAYPLLGPQLFDHLTSVVLDSLALPQIDWLSIESALFCLNGLALSVGGYSEGSSPEARDVQRIFQSNLWEVLPQCENTRVRQTAVDVIGYFVDYFLSPAGEKHLAVTLTYLFTSLATVDLQNMASRSIQKICDKCRKQLVNEVPAFLTVYSQLLQQAELQLTPQLRTVGGIACVIQAMPNTSAKAEALDHLMTLVTAHASSASSNNEDDQREQRHTLLKCIAAIGKNVQEPEPKPTALQGFWDTDRVALNVHLRLQTIVRSMIGSPDVEEVETTCDILKSGMTEYEGAFVFSQTEVVEFVRAEFEAGPSAVLGPILDLSRFFISTQLAAAKVLRCPGPPLEILEGFVGAARHAGQNWASHSLDLLTQILHSLAFSEQDFADMAGSPEALLELALPGLASSDRFVLRSAASFWSLYASKMRLEGQDLGMKLVNALLLQISGQASRSDLSPVTEVLKSLLQNHPLVTMRWLKSQVVDAPVLRNVATQDLKVRSEFIAQLALVKGQRKTGEVVQRFWLKSRGIPESYKPQGNTTF